MKTYIKTIFYFCILLLASCNQPSDMLTVINSDGSCYREFTSMVDPDFLLGDTTAKLNPFPVLIDSTWDVKWENTSGFRTDYPISKATYDSLIYNGKANLSNTELPKGVNTTVSVKEISSLHKTKQKDGVTVKVKTSLPLSKRMTDSIQQQVKTKVDKALADTSDSKKPNETKIKMLIRHTYTSVEEMAKNFKFKPGSEWSKKKIGYSLEKNFRWFYTYYTYKEVFPASKIKLEVPIDKYLSKDEAGFWLTGKPNLTEGMNGVEMREFAGQIEEKYNNWFAENRWNSEFKELLIHYSELNNTPVSKEKIASLRDSIFKTIENKQTDFKMPQVLDNFFKTTAFSNYWNIADNPMAQFENKIDEQLINEYSLSINYALILPGKTISAEGAICHGDTLMWRVTSYRMLQSDFTLTAQSRKANIWAFILTGIVIAIAIGSFIWKGKK